MDLNELADRVEALAGPDAEVDALIRCALFASAGAYVKQSPINGAWCIYEIGFNGKERSWQPHGLSHEQRLGSFTASIDAAMTLADPSWWLNISSPLSEAAYGYSREDLRVMRAGFEMIGPPYSSAARTDIVGDPVSRIARVLTAAALRTKALGAVHTLEGGL